MTTLAIRDDTLYLIGFQNGMRQWYEFGFSRKSKPVLPEDGCNLQESDEHRQ